ncbi:MAG: pyrroline-5-carboxylate reductase [Clostridia bacterium]|nr:pyrroline-5-carboxylate reductase [Clostridia bacterium]
MGGAIAAAVCKALDGSCVHVSALHPENAAKFAFAHGAAASDNMGIAKDCDFVVLGVKPQYMEEVLQPLQAVLANRSRVVLVTMAAGLTMQRIRELAGGNYPVIRIMPNTPSLVGAGVIQYDMTDDVLPEEKEAFLHALAPAGMLDPLPEKLIDAGSALSGCGPAFCAMFMEALADGGVSCGLPRKKALEYAAQTLLGTAKLMLETGDHPGRMKDNVTSPGGSTIQGVRALEKGGMRSAVMEAVIAAYEKNKDLGAPKK